MRTEEVYKVPDTTPLLFWLYFLIILPFFVCIPNILALNRRKSKKPLSTKIIESQRTYSFDKATMINSSFNSEPSSYIGSESDELERSISLDIDEEEEEEVKDNGFMIHVNMFRYEPPNGMKIYKMLKHRRQMYDL